MNFSLCLRDAISRKHLLTRMPSSSLPVSFSSSSVPDRLLASRERLLPPAGADVEENGCSELDDGTKDDEQREDSHADEDNKRRLCAGAGAAAAAGAKGGNTEGEAGDQDDDIDDDDDGRK
mmetsp:Transcript_6043/g.14600  ORF Transcript_6043/g.14600 Transcript_6043/m.14600 type:complete len:121 (+) Transcript_6043:1112-1474(+)